MALYNPPDGYLYDSNSGLYYSQVVTQDVFVPMLFQAGMSSGQSYIVTHKEEFVEGYDYFGNIAYDSRYDD